MTDQVKETIRIVLDSLVKFSGPAALFVMAYSLNYLINVEERLDDLEVSKAVCEATISLEFRSLRQVIEDLHRGR